MWEWRPIFNSRQTMPAHHAIHFFLNILELLRMKNYGEKKSVHRRYRLSRGYQRIEKMDFLSILTVSSAAEGELWLVIDYDMKRKKLWKLPANSVPADPLISSSSSGVIDPSGSRWESNNVEVYDGTALPDIYGSIMRIFAPHNFTVHWPCRIWLVQMGYPSWLRLPSEFPKLLSWTLKTVPTWVCAFQS